MSVISDDREVGTWVDLDTEDRVRLVGSQAVQRCRRAAGIR